MSLQREDTAFEASFIDTLGLFEYFHQDIAFAFINLSLDLCGHATKLIDIVISRIYGTPPNARLLSVLRAVSRQASRT